MTDADLDKLEALAKAAGGKEWRLGGGGFVAEGDAPIADFLAMPDPDDWKSGPSIGDAIDRAKFVAAANPSTILDLIASARRDAEEIERLRETLIQADLKIRSLPGTDQSCVEFIRLALAIEKGRV